MLLPSSDGMDSSADIDGIDVPWCINTGKSLIPLTLRFLAQKRNLLIPLELSRVMHQGNAEAQASSRPLSELCTKARLSC